MSRSVVKLKHRFEEVRGRLGSTENFKGNRADLDEKRQFRKFALSIPEQVGYRTQHLEAAAKFFL